MRPDLFVLVDTFTWLYRWLVATSAFPFGGGSLVTCLLINLLSIPSQMCDDQIL